MSGTLKAAKSGARGFRAGPSSGSGDPGLFGNFFGGLAGAAKGIFAGSTIGRALTGFKGGAGGTSRPLRPMAGPPQPGGFALPRLPIPTSFAGPGPVATGTAMTTTGGAGTAVVPIQPAGHHLNKTSYFLIDGTFVPARSRWVKNRRRNPLNPRALRRAISRIDAGKIWQGKLHEISTAKFTAAGNRKD